MKVLETVNWTEAEMKDFETKCKAAELWHAMDENEKTGVRFGLFPYERMTAAEKEGFNGRKLCVELMARAKADGGMRA